LALAEKAEDLARYYREAEKYPGIAAFFQQFLVLPVTAEQEAVPRIESSLLRVQQMQKLHLDEARLLRQRARREPKPVTFISREKNKRSTNAFIHLMTELIDQHCGKRHNRAVAMLASMAFDRPLDNEDVRKALAPSTKEGRRRRIRTPDAKKS
jgi:folylpolyglutamate synthase/dihydropteroate synthase